MSLLLESLSRLPTASAGSRCGDKARNALHEAKTSLQDARNESFAKLTRQRLERGVFRSVVDLQLTINRFVADIIADPKPFVWTADPKRVLAAVKRGKQTLESIHQPSSLAAETDELIDGFKNDARAD
jgi:hypothetical protein